MAETSGIDLMCDRLSKAEHAREQRKLDAAFQAGADARARECAEIAEDVRHQWATSAKNVARADDLVGSLAQSTYQRYAEIAEEVASKILKLVGQPVKEKEA